jgi:hypothetical protein
MAVARVQVTIPRVNDIPADAVVNTLHYQLQDAGGAPLGDFILEADAVLLADSVADAFAGSSSLWSNLVKNELTVEVYDMAAPEPRVPLAVDTRTGFGARASSAYPGEIAVCLSHRAEATSGAIAARRRGRIYLGPIPSSAGAVAANGEVRVSTTYRNNVLTFAASLEEGAATLPDVFRLGVFSRTSLVNPNDPDAAFSRSTEWFIDDAFDIQRRRGAAPTVRQVQAFT